jgi:exodeoxyribonuclease VII large subunit
MNGISFDPSSMAGPAPDPERKPLTVSELTGRIKRLLEGEVGSVWVEGEISNLRTPRSGHLYLTLKDENATLPAVMFRRAARKLTFELEEGLSVVAFGEVTVYAPRGAYQIVLEHVEPKGLGALQLRFEQLRKKLEEEGLFDPARKKPLPYLPGRIGVVTSATGAAIRDIVSIVLRRFPRPHILLFPVRVQGEEAAAEIADAIDAFNRMNGADVLIVGRGGGSLEDLWPFNEEVVARAIARSRIPVISAVGHEIDFTISDFVADRRAGTPSEAAEIVLPEYQELLETLGRFEHRLAQALRAQLRAQVERLRSLGERLSGERARRLVTERVQRLDELTMRAESACRRSAARWGERIEALGKILEGFNPRSVLARGYSMTVPIEGTGALRDANDARPGMRVRTHLHRGTFVSRVEPSDPDRTQG